MEVKNDGGDMDLKNEWISGQRWAGEMERERERERESAGFRRPKPTHSLLSSHPKGKRGSRRLEDQSSLSLSAQLCDFGQQILIEKMPEMDGSSNSRPPQISEMFQKFAVAVKTKTYEFFAEEEAAEDSDGFCLLDSLDEVITNQKVVVIKPGRSENLSPSLQSEQGNSCDETQMRKPKIESFSQLRATGEHTRRKTMDPLLTQTIISSIIATISSFEASYLQLQTAHVPFDEECAKKADRALVSHLQRLSDFKHFYTDFRCNVDFPFSSCLEAQVQENQSKLRTLGTVSDRLQSEIDQKDSIVSDLRKKLSEIQLSNSKLSMKLSGNSHTSSEVLLSVRVFDTLLREACRETHKFTKVLMELMKKSGWDVNLAANSVHPDVEYSKKGHNRYAFLSYVCLGMFRGFDSSSFDLKENDDSCSGNTDKNTSSLQKLLEHVSSNPMELLKKDHSSEFSRFCEKKYEELIHPTMESSIFYASEEKDQVLNSWRSVGVFYNLFVKMASSIWTLHKLAYSFDPIVDIYRVEKGADFSVVFMEDVTKRYLQAGRTRPKVGFTVVPGFKIGRTMIQSRVYLCPPTFTEDCRREDVVS